MVRSVVKTLMVGLGLALVSQLSYANSVAIILEDGSNYQVGGVDYTVSCTGSSDPCMVGYFSPDGAYPTVGAVVEDASDPYTATGFGVTPSSTENELAFLNDILSVTEPAAAPVTTAVKTNVAGTGFTTAYDYFSIKQSGWTAYFKRAASGPITITTSSGYSHYTEYGEVPLPASAPLFALALAGLGLVSRRRKQRIG